MTIDPICFYTLEIQSLAQTYWRQVLLLLLIIGVQNLLHYVWYLWWRKWLWRLVLSLTFFKGYANRWLCVTDPAANDGDMRWRSGLTVTKLPDQCSTSHLSLGLTFSFPPFLPASLPQHPFFFGLLLNYPSNLWCHSCRSITPMSAQHWHSNDILIICLQMSNEMGTWEMGTCSEPFSINWGGSSMPRCDKNLKWEIFGFCQCMKLHSKI